MKRFRRSAAMVEMALSPPSLRSKRRRTTELAIRPTEIVLTATEVPQSEEKPDSPEDEILSTPPDAQSIPEDNSSMSDAPAKKNVEIDHDEILLRARKSPEKLFRLEDEKVEEVKGEEKAVAQKQQPLGPLNPPSPRKSSAAMRAPISRPLRLSSRGLRMIALARPKEEPVEEEVLTKPGDTSLEHLSEDEHPAPLESLPKFDAQKPWIRYTYSPSASPRTGILKVSPSPSAGNSSGQRVRFSSEIDEVEIPAEGKLRSLPGKGQQSNKARRGLLYGAGSKNGSEKSPLESLLSVGEEPTDPMAIDDLVAAEDEGAVNPAGSKEGDANGEVGTGGEEKAEGKPEQQEVQQKEETQEENEDEKHELWEPFYPALLGCTEAVASLVAELTPANWVPMLKEALAEHEVQTIGDFARLSVAMINNLPIIAPAGKTPVEIAKKKLGLFEDTPSPQEKQKPPFLKPERKSLITQKPLFEQRHAETMTEKPNAQEIRAMIRLEFSQAEKLDLFIDLLQDKQLMSSPRSLDFVLRAQRNQIDAPTLVDLARDKVELFNLLARDEKVVKQASEDAIGSIFNCLEPQRLVANLQPVAAEQVFDHVAENNVATFGRKFSEVLSRSENAVRECSFSDCVSICESLLTSRSGVQKALLSNTSPAAMAEAIKPHKLPEFTEALKKHLKVSSWSQLRLEMEQKASLISSGAQTDKVEPGKEEFLAVLNNLACGSDAELVAHAKNIAACFHGNAERNARCRNLLSAIGYHLWANGAV